MIGFYNMHVSVEVYARFDVSNVNYISDSGHK